MFTAQLLHTHTHTVDESRFGNEWKRFFHATLQWQTG